MFSFLKTDMPGWQINNPSLGNTFLIFSSLIVKSEQERIEIVARPGKPASVHKWGPSCLGPSGPCACSRPRPWPHEPGNHRSRKGSSLASCWTWTCQKGRPLGKPATGQPERHNENSRKDQIHIFPKDVECRNRKNYHPNVINWLKLVLLTYLHQFCWMRLLLHFGFLCRGVWHFGSTNIEAWKPSQNEVAFKVVAPHSSSRRFTKVLQTHAILCG